MRLKTFIVDENRGRSVEFEDAMEIITKNCKVCVKHYLANRDNILWRGIGGSRGTYYVIDPSKSERESANTKNYYTWIMDNDPRWKGFPLRSRSIVCATNKVKSEIYGTLYYVFPFDGANFGIASVSDIWQSFTKTMGFTTYLGALNRSLDSLSEYLNFPMGNVKTYAQFDKRMKVLSDEIEEIIEDPDNDRVVNSTLAPHYPLFGMYMKSGPKQPFYQWFVGLFDPKANGIEHTTNLGKVLSTRDREVWTDSKSVLVSAKYAGPDMWGWLKNP